MVSVIIYIERRLSSMMELFTSDAVKIICLLFGVGLMAVEIMIPGFGIAGIGGLVLMGIGTACMWIQHGMLAGLLTMLAVIILAIIECVIIVRSASKGRLSRSQLILNSEISKEETNSVQIGQKGKTLTVLNPVGFADIDGVRTEVLCEAGYVEKDVTVTVIAVQGNKVTVRK